MRGLAIAVLAACGGQVPETRYYQLATPSSPMARAGDATVAIESLTTDPAYDDERIVYRLTPYRLDYYQYHRWSSPPGAMIGAYLAQAFQRSGKFRAVTRGAGETAPVVLGGRVIALEEVDVSKTSWLGRISVELTLSDATSGQVLWTEQFDETEPLEAQSPEGLSRAITIAMRRIAGRAAPAVAELAAHRQSVQARAR
jgi:ABC-type uncharacterized transport system auxiliary subunit